MNQLQAVFLPISLCAVLLLAAPASAAQWSAEPGATVRDAFGPSSTSKGNRCRGACGAGCPDSCAQAVTYECLDASRLRRVVTYQCGTHPGCRAHDDCLDSCLENAAQGTDCSSRCDNRVLQDYGFESATSWFGGGGPYDGKIRFQYTRDAPGDLEPAYRCPEGARRLCGDDAGCVAAGGGRVAPVFDSYPDAAAGAMRISAFRSGPVCGDSVCAQADAIQVTGADSCPGGQCTRFGMEFDYENADPTAPLECSTSTSGGDDDFVGGLLKQGADALSSRGALPDDPGADSEGDGMAQLMGLFGKVLSSADSPEDVNISMAPLDESGNPIESQRVGSAPRDGPPPIPRSVDLPAANGHLFVPMYQLSDGLKAGQAKQRKLTCTHKGAPVLETIFVLNAG